MDMGIPRRLFGDLSEGIWGSDGVKWRLFGDVGEWTWGSGLLRASLRADWCVQRPLEQSRLAVFPIKSHSCSHQTCRGQGSSPKTLTVVLDRVLHISLIRRFSVH